MRLSAPSLCPSSQAGDIRTEPLHLLDSGAVQAEAMLPGAASAQRICEAMETRKRWDEAMMKGSNGAKRWSETMRRIYEKSNKASEESKR